MDVAAIRPPWTQDSVLEEECTGCGRCREACTLGLIALDERGRPYMDFGPGGCTFCATCAHACPEDLFDLDRPPLRLRARVDGPCLTVPTATCDMCRTVCLEAAVHIEVSSGGVRLAAIDPARCNGCGACLSACPTDAIVLRETG
jgi:ferredoxin-type protein NapF